MKPSYQLSEKQRNSHQLSAISSQTFFPIVIPTERQRRGISSFPNIPDKLITDQLIAEYAMISSMTYQVKLQTFEGPLDLLLTLISKKELDIYEIALSDITDEYLAYIEQIKELNLEVASEFLVIAATLLEIKSRGLIPSEQIQEAEPLTAETVKKELIKRLINYKKYKNAASYMKQSLDVGSKYHKRQAELEEQFVGLMPDFDEQISIAELANYLIHLVRVRYFAQVNTSHITATPISVEEQTDYLLAKLNNGAQTFKALTEGFGRQEIIVTFLAVLELCRRLMVDVKQSTNFGQIELEIIKETI